MAKRYVDVEELKKRAYPFPCAIGVEYAVSIRQIDETPTADVEEVRHGEWVTESRNGSEEVCRCTACNELLSFFGFYKAKYCSICGAKMDGERK